MINPDAIAPLFMTIICVAAAIFLIWKTLTANGDECIIVMEHKNGHSSTLYGQYKYDETGREFCLYKE